MADSLSFELYGGVGVIGGNKILMKSRKGRGREQKVWLDFGTDFKLNSMFFSEFVNPRKANGITDLIKLGLLPKLEGLYRPDYVLKSGHNPGHPVDYDLVALSHAHFDHMGYVSHLHPEIHLLSSKPTYAIMKALQESGYSSDKDFVEFREYYKHPNAKDRLCVQRKFSFIEEGKFALDDLVFEGCPVDHSLPGATAYIIQTPKGNVVYTGDLRFHGMSRHLTDEFVKKAAESKPLALITEGTNVDVVPEISEQAVYKRISDAVKGAKALVVANFPGRDLERLNTFLKAAKSNGRKLAIDLKQAYLLKCMFDAGCAYVSPALNPNAKDPLLQDLFSEDIVVFAKQKEHGMIVRDYPLEEAVKDYTKWERLFIAQNVGEEKKPSYLLQKYVRHANDIRNHQEKYVVFNDNYSVQNLIDFQPAEGSVYIYSKTEPFDVEMEADYERLENWVGKFFGGNMVTAHSSGHAYGAQLLNMVKTINPQAVIPVHTEHPEIFAERLKKADNRLRIKEPYQGTIIIPELSTTERAVPIEL